VVPHVFGRNGRLQPLTVLLGIVMGSALSLFVGLFMTLVVYLLLPEFHDRLSGEFRPLIVATAWTFTLTMASTAAFAAQVRSKPWRRTAYALLIAAVAGIVWSYWPR
jgi:MFS superfamily sulfate permease-like transporter